MFLGLARKLRSHKVAAVEGLRRELLSVSLGRVNLPAQERDVNNASCARSEENHLQ